MTKFRYTMFVVTVLLALALSAMITVPALADDSVPPPTETPTVETPPTEAATEVIPPVEAAAPTEVPLVEETVPPASTEAGLLASLPEGTELVVLDESGNALPLATKEASNALEDPDPFWCPSGVAPNPSNPACSLDFGSLSALLADTSGSPYANGTIWIQWGPDAGTAAVIDGFSGNWAGSSPFSLTLQGGWEGTPGSAALHLADPYSYFDTSISINWAGTITLNNIVFSGVTSGTALTILTNKNITLNNVDVVNNTGGTGAVLNNTTGTGNVVVNDSTFNGNSGDGLYVWTNGTITAKNLSANNNSQNGVLLYNNTGSSAKAVTLTGSNNFKFNGWNGLFVYSQGAISLSNVTAIYNTGGSGVEVNNCFYDDPSGYCTSLASSPITIKGASNFSNNGFDGLRVWSSGAITLGNITANNNGTDAARPGQTLVYDAYGKGVFLHNFGSYSPKAITLTGTNSFNNNASTGFYSFGWSKISVNNLTANDNGCNLAKESAFMCDGALLDGSGVALTGYGVFNGNYDDGLFASSYGAVTLNNLYAENNGRRGVVVDSFGPGAMVNVLGTNTFINNANNGLNIWSAGAVTLNNITANDNGVDGVYVDNCLYDNTSDPSPLVWDCRVTTPKPVTLKGTNFFNGNVGTGFNVFSTGVITTSNITALLNGNGVNLDNCIWETDPLVDDCKALAGKAVTMNGANNINDNVGDGLYIQSLGAIKVNNLTSTFNGGAGAILDNNWTAAVGGVTITGFANTSSNGIRGMAIFSRGAVLTSNLTANFNGPTTAASGNTFNRGVFIGNATTPGKLMNVTLLGINQFNGNWNTGLQISSYGVVVLNNITANNNGEPFDGTNNPTPEGNGVKVDNSGASSAKSVTLNGVNIFNGNLDNGLFIQSKGAIVVNKVTANDNGVDGAQLNNQNGSVNSALSLLGYGTFNGNGDTGLVVFSNGKITLNTLTANDSVNGRGASIDNYSNTTTPVSVTLLGVNSFNGNASDGLVVYSDGAITLNNITANDNGGDGAYLNNTAYQILVPLKVGNITLNGTNTFVNNILNGLHFDATGNVTMTRVTADLNNDGVIGGSLSAGVLGTAAGTISLTCGSINFNEGRGYDLTAGVGKLITLKGVFTYSNGLANFSSSPTLSPRTCPLP